MLRFISMILLVVGIIAVGAIVSVFLMGPNSPIAALIAPYICEDGGSLVVGSHDPSFDNTVPLACDVPDSEYDKVVDGILIQWALGAFIPFGLGLWLLRISMRWQAAGEYAKRMGYTSEPNA